MREELFKLEETFQPYLLHGDYTFVGPQDQGQPLHDFIKAANLIAPVVAFSRSVHHALSNKAATRQALNALAADTPLRIYVAFGNHPEVLGHTTIEDYCERNKIDFKPED